MRTIGQILATAGAAGFLAAMFLMQTSVEGPIGSEVTNLALQQRQLLAAIGCAGLFLAGVVMACIGEVIDALSLSATAQPAAETLDDEADVMKRFGITKEPNGYRAGDFVYGAVDEAVRASKQRSPER